MIPQCSLTLLWLGLACACTVSASAQTLYSIGEPSDEEQLFLQLINRARANPTAEGQRLAGTKDPDVLNAYKYFGVNLSMMQQEFAALPVRPPLAFNAKLIAAARGHSEDMLQNVFQGHKSSNGSDMGQRIDAVGYGWQGIGENVYAYADTVWQGHAGFQVDWGGGGTGGMQKGRGHRMNIHGDYREVGIGVVLGSKTAGGITVGPLLVTQDFANPWGSAPFLTGVAYEDKNTNGFYDLGEGLEGVTVTVSGAKFYAVSAGSGGFAVPLPAGDTTRTVTFQDEALTRQVQVVISAGANVQADYARSADDDGDDNPFAFVPTGNWANVVGFGWCYGNPGTWVFTWGLGICTPPTTPGSMRFLPATCTMQGDPIRLAAAPFTAQL